jgi:TorA maturation chaperone TorD
MPVSPLEENRKPVVDDVDRARAEEYALLATLLAHSPDAPMIGRLALLRGDATPLGCAHAALGAAATHTSAAQVRREYFELFDGVGRGKLMPYASYYMTGSTYGRPLSRLRQTLQRLGIARVADCTEPEDHGAVLCEIMAGLAGGDLAGSAGAEREFFEHHLSPWIGRFFADLERAESADFYARVGEVGRIFVDVETKAFALLA